MVLFIILAFILTIYFYCCFTDGCWYDDFINVITAGVISVVSALLVSFALILTITTLIPESSKNIEIVKETPLIEFDDNTYLKADKTHYYYFYYDEQNNLKSDKFLNDSSVYTITFHDEDTAIKQEIKITYKNKILDFLLYNSKKEIYYIPLDSKVESIYY